MSYFEILLGSRGGFYKRGCQEKTLLHLRREWSSFGIQPLTAAPLHFFERASLLFRAGGSWLKFRGPSLCADKQRAGIMPTMVLSEARDRSRRYGFVGLSEGAYGGPW